MVAQVVLEPAAVHSAETSSDAAVEDGVPCSNRVPRNLPRSRVMVSVRGTLLGNGPYGICHGQPE